MCAARYYVNPYNFVQLPKTECIKKPYQKGNLTGYIDYTLTTKTDLFIPDTREGFDATQFQFFNYDKNVGEFVLNPVIPGSELKGMVRNIYEVITNSCLSTSPNLNFTTRTDPADAKKAGLLMNENGTWSLYGADSYSIIGATRAGDEKQGYYMYYNGKKYQTGDHFCIENVVITKKKRKTKNLDGYVIVGEPFIGENGENHSHVFVKKNEIKKVTEDDINALKELLILYKDEKSNKKLKQEIKENDRPHSGYREYQLEGKDVLPVWFAMTDDGKLYLSPAAIGKCVFKTTLYDFIDSYKKCDSKNLCPTCQLFGTANDELSVKSRLRFSDATFMGNASKDIYRKDQVLRELGSPNYSNMEFYGLYAGDDESIDEKRWYWDYYGKKQNSFNEGEVEIRGRKLYLHNCFFKPKDHQLGPYITDTKLVSPRCKTINPIKENQKFKARLYFENITQKELNNLVYALSLGKEDKNCHKLGMGKPLGLGSVSVSIDSVKKRILKVDDLKQSIHFVFENLDYSFEDIDETQPVIKQLKRVTDYHLMEHQQELHNNVLYGYPDFDTQTEASDVSTGTLKWFDENNPTQDHTFSRLPTLDDDDLSLVSTIE